MFLIMLPFFRTVVCRIAIGYIAKQKWVKNTFIFKYVMCTVHNLFTK